VTATFDQIVTVAADTLFQQRVGVAMIQTANNVYTEAFGGTGQPTQQQHQTRSAYARLVLSRGVNLNQIATAVTTLLIATVDVTQPHDYALSDTDIGNACASLWNFFAGA